MSLSLSFPRSIKWLRTELPCRFLVGPDDTRNGVPGTLSVLSECGLFPAHRGPQPATAVPLMLMETRPR